MYRYYHAVFKIILYKKVKLNKDEAGKIRLMVDGG